MDTNDSLLAGLGAISGFGCIEVISASYRPGQNIAERSAKQEKRIFRVLQKVVWFFIVFSHSS